MFTILMVCTGNTCRSPMAAAILKNIAAKLGYGDKIKVTSAGVSAWAEPASENARAVMSKRGLSLENHRSEQLTADKVKEADLVLTMTGSHKQAVLRLMPEAFVKVFTLPEFSSQNGGVVEKFDIADPFGSNQDGYEHCALQIEFLTGKSFEKIIELYLG